MVRPAPVLCVHNQRRGIIQIIFSLRVNLYAMVVTVFVGIQVKVLQIAARAKAAATNGALKDLYLFEEAIVLAIQKYWIVPRLHLVVLPIQPLEAHVLIVPLYIV